MSLLKSAVVCCATCKKQQEIPIYKSINTATDPGLVAKVMDGSLFLWECPHCHAKSLAKYECLYHNPDQRFMVWLLPLEMSSEAEQASIAMHAKALGAYTLRKCTEVGELVEKVHVLEAGLDDVAIELCKFIILQELQQKAASEGEKAEIISTPIHFYRKEEDKLVFAIQLNKQMNELAVGNNVYEDALGIIHRNPSLTPAPGFQRIDAIWLSSVLR
jgi:hypothetical protein